MCKYSVSLAGNIVSLTTYDSRNPRGITRTPSPFGYSLFKRESLLRVTFCCVSYLCSQATLSLFSLLFTMFSPATFGRKGTALR